MTGRQDIFTLPNIGSVSIEWPDELTMADYRDVAEFLELVKRKMARAAVCNGPTEPTPSEPSPDARKTEGGERDGEAA